MRLQYLLIFLATLICLDASPRGNRPASTHSRRDPARPSLATATGPASFFSSASSKGRSLSRPSIWRHRIKSVLEKHARGLQPIDLGPVKIPDRLGASIGSARGRMPSRPLIPLRC